MKTRIHLAVLAVLTLASCKKESAGEHAAIQATCRHCTVTWSYRGETKTDTLRYSVSNGLYGPDTADGTFKVWINSLLPGEGLSLQVCNLDTKFVAVTLPDTSYTDTVPYSISARLLVSNATREFKEQAGGCVYVQQ